MLKLTVIACLVALVLGQRPQHGDFNLAEWLAQNVVDDIHGLAVEYDDHHDLILLVNMNDCYLVSARDTTWDNVVTHQDQLNAITTVLYHQIMANIGVTSISQHAAETLYHSRVEEWQCRDKLIHQVVYDPPTVAPTTV